MFVDDGRVHEQMIVDFFSFFSVGLGKGAGWLQYSIYLVEYKRSVQVKVADKPA